MKASVHEGGRRGATLFLILLAFSAPLTAGCSADAIRLFLGQQVVPDPYPKPAVAVARPNTNTPAAVGAPAVIQWADLADLPGTVISVRAQRKNAVDENDGPELALLDNRDALIDGEGDIFNWDVTGVRVGSYEIRVIISSPDGKSAEATANGRFNVTTALPIPSLTFTAPGAADVTFNPGDTFNIAWTDNGDAAAQARMTLGLDLNFDHQQGNEIILLRDQLLSTDGNSGSFAFAGVDENGAAVPPQTYIVFAILDDGVNNPVTARPTGRIVVTP